ncbi:MAG: response regulator [SAR324 cluster bacterium]|nr:response regulator [SAR324 cluster bacterium]
MKKILVVEDDPIIIISLEFLMEQNGYQVLTAINGEDALELAKRQLPDLILLDVMLPGGSGYEICHKLRALKKMTKTKIVLLTARGRGVDVQKGLDAGADTYITKPFSTVDLVKTVKDLLADED